MIIYGNELHHNSPISRLTIENTVKIWKVSDIFYAEDVYSHKEKDGSSLKYGTETVSFYLEYKSIIPDVLIENL